MSLPVLASLSPPDADIRLVDESVERVDLDAEADLVAISTMTAAAPRAYEIADHFRHRGIPVVMGGMHPSAMPEEAGHHADAVVVGEAEGQWDQVLSDFSRGRPKALYKADSPPCFEGWPIPRRDLLQSDRYLTTCLVQTSRGCPYGCTFCSVTRVFGRKYRFRPLDEVLEEVRSLNPTWVGFTDDNIVANPERAKQLFEALIPLKLKWVGQGDLSMARDSELMHLMRRSGCMAMFVGLESISPESLAAAAKGPNLRVDYEATVRKIHQHGIDIIGSFVFGLDPDTEGSLRKTVEFAERMKLCAAQFAVLTPFPGTDMFDQLKEEERITDWDWAKYTMGHVVYRPRNMTAEKLFAERWYAYTRFYSRWSIFRRLFVRRGRLGRWASRLVLNMSYRRLHRGGTIARTLPGDVGHVAQPATP